MSATNPRRQIETAESIRVVIIDPDVRVRRALASTIDGEPDLEVVGTASVAQAALGIVSAATPCVALTDVGGCDLDLSCLALLRGVPGCQVVAMSVRSSVRSDSMAAGAVEFVVKGGDPEEVLDVVRRAGGSTQV